ncbi:hypothetical protein ACERZ8_17355 [Tateyamaria armeniaca]|uniref:Uncharacterized protein n=1 Tax=Tateyamaria armeniaca TaxID=2518930 RepID=A0ABW8V2F0_9RHOB
MAQKADTSVFDDGDAMKQFILGQNRRVEAWFLQHWQRLDGITGPIHKSTVSRALTGMPIPSNVANAFDTLFDEMRDDPWEWCEPPETLDNLTDYAPLSWWFKTLKPPLSWSRFERIKTHPLDGDDLELTQQRLTQWRDALKAACDQYKTDQALARAYQADFEPEFQHWIVEDGEIRLFEGMELAQHEAGKWSGAKPFRRRVGNPGLYGRSEDEIGLAYALADAVLTLPNVEKACLTYSRPSPVVDTEHFSEPVEPWNGPEFEGIEFDEFKHTPEYSDHTTWQVKHRVCFYWDGQQYQAEDVEPFAQVRIPKHRNDEPEWRVPTADERDLFETGVERKHKTRDELMLVKDEFIAQIWENQKESWAENEYGSRFNKQAFPDGVPRSCAEDAFEACLGRVDVEAAADEQREVARQRMAFRRRLRRRPQ